MVFFLMGVLKMPSVAFLREDLGEDLIQADDPRDKSHFQPIVEDLVLSVMSVE